MNTGPNYASKRDSWPHAPGGKSASHSCGRIVTLPRADRRFAISSLSSIDTGIVLLSERCCFGGFCDSACDLFDLPLWESLNIWMRTGRSKRVGGPVRGRKSRSCFRRLRKLPWNLGKYRWPAAPFRRAFNSSRKQGNGRQSLRSCVCARGLKVPNPADLDLLLATFERVGWTSQ